MYLIEITIYSFGLQENRLFKTIYNLYIILYMILKLLTNFLFGGLLFVLIYLAANIYKRPEISSLLSLLPLSIICGYIIHDREILVKHNKNLIPISIFTIVVTILLIVLLKYNVNPFIAITSVLIFWIITQYLRIKYFPVK